MGEALKGKCMCGACRLTAVPQSMTSGACHCEMCRHWTGGVLMTVDCGDTLVVGEGSPVGVYRGSAWGERLFCRECGSSLVWRTQDGKHNQVSVQVFDNPQDFPLSLEVFHDCKPDSYAFANETKKMTEAEIFAMFGPSGDQA